MAYLSKKEFEKQLAEVQRENASKARREYLKKERRKYARKRKKPSTSKLLLWTAVIVCVQIIVFCEAAFLLTRDSGFLYALASAPATLVPTIVSYYSKAKCENTAGGIVYETAMSQIETGGGEEAVG